MNKICTSLEQSKKLVELGIDVNTADIIYNVLDESYIRHGTPIDKYHTPAWSLSALMELLPLPTLEETPITDTETKWQCTIYCDKAKYWSELHDEPIDAAFEMVYWILENNKI